MENLLSTVHAISKDIDLDYGIRKCGVLVFKKVVKREGIKLSDGQVVKEIGEETYKYMGIDEYNKIMEDKTKEAFRKRVFENKSHCALFQT